jgi:flagellar basal-body rod protein FlgC
MDLVKSMMASASGMQAQGERMRIIAENLANANSVGRNPDEDPYRRKILSFRNVLNREQGVELVEVGKVQNDRSEFRLRYNPGHPAANDRGYVRLPNVNSIIEMNDMREAQRSYEANIRAVEAAKRMLMNTVDLLR